MSFLFHWYTIPSKRHDFYFIFSEVLENEVNLYEIPVPKGVQSPPKENDYEETTISPIPTEKEEQSASPVPPPLPPRRDRTSSDAQSRSSCGSILEEIKPGLPLRPQLTPKSEIYKGSNERLVEDDFCGRNLVLIENLYEDIFILLVVSWILSLKMTLDLSGNNLLTSSNNDLLNMTSKFLNCDAIFCWNLCDFK